MYYLLFFILCVSLIVCKFDIPIISILKNSPKLILSFFTMQKEKFKSKKNPTLKQKIDKILGNQKQNIIQKNFSEASKILTVTNQVNKIKLIKSICILLSILGGILSLITKNILLLPVLSIGFALIPLWVIRYNEFHYKKRLSSELETALSVITTSYIRTRNIQRAFEENISYIKKPVVDEFNQFLNRIKYIDPSIITSIKELKQNFNNSTFIDWCDALILCQDDNTLIPTLLPIVKQFSVDKDLQNSLETIILQPIRSYLTLCVMAFSIIPMFYIINRDWFDYLINSFFGKVSITAAVIVVFMGINKAISISTPLD